MRYYRQAVLENLFFYPNPRDAEQYIPKSINNKSSNDYASDIFDVSTPNKPLLSKTNQENNNFKTREKNNSLSFKPFIIKHILKNKIHFHLFR